MTLSMSIKHRVAALALSLVAACALAFCAAAPALAAQQQELQGEAYALYDASEHSLVFDRGADPVLQADQQIFRGFETQSYGLNTTPWAGVARTVATVRFDGVIRPQSTAYWFASFRNAVSFDLAKLDTSQVTDMSAMFKTCTRLNTVDVTGFDTSKVTKMESMFDNCTNLGYLDVTHWDTSNVTTMYAMFLSCTSLTYLDLSHWDTSKVRNMAVMFSDADHLVAINLSGLDTSSIESMHLMFFGCYQLTDLDLSSFTSENIFDTKATGYSGGYSFFGYDLFEREGWTRMLQRITMNGAYSTYEDFTFPTPSSEYVPGADGLWYDAAGNSYCGQVPTRTARTYYGSPTLAGKTDIAGAVVSIAGGQLSASGAPVEPSVSVMLGGRQLAEGVDYTVTYFNNSYAGIATAAVYGAGAYRGAALGFFTLQGEDHPVSAGFEPEPVQPEQPQEPVVSIPATVTVGGVVYVIDAAKGTARVTGLSAAGKRAASLTVRAQLSGTGWSVRVTGIAPKALKGSKATKLVIKSAGLSKARVANSLKGSQVKTVQVKVSGGSKVRAAYLAKCKKWFKASNCGRGVSVR